MAVAGELDLARKLNVVNAVGIASMAIHDADHVRQGVMMQYQIPIHIILVLSAAYLPLLASLWWTRKGRYLWATMATALVLFGVLLLLGFVHLVGLDVLSSSLADFFGMWGMSYWRMKVDAISWAALGLLGVTYGGLLVCTLCIRRAARASAAVQPILGVSLSRLRSRLTSGVVDRPGKMLGVDVPSSAVVSVGGPSCSAG